MQGASNMRGDSIENKKELILYAKELAYKCKIAAQSFGNRSKKIDSIKKTLMVLELLFASLALVSNIPYAKSFFSQTSLDGVGLVSAILMMTIIIIDKIYSKDPPERLQDYAFYMLTFSAKIKSTIANYKEGSSIYILNEQIDTINSNLADIGAKWPSIMLEIESNSANIAVE